MADNTLRLNAHLVLFNRLHDIGILALPVINLRGQFICESLHLFAGLNILGLLDDLRDSRLQFVGHGFGLRLQNGTQFSRVLDAHERQKAVLQCLERIVRLLDQIGQCCWQRIVSATVGWCLANLTAIGCLHGNEQAQNDDKTLGHIDDVETLR